MPLPCFATDAGRMLARAIPALAHPYAFLYRKEILGHY
jgi:hypothetical protein